MNLFIAFVLVAQIATGFLIKIKETRLASFGAFCVVKKKQRCGNKQQPATRVPSIFKASPGPLSPPPLPRKRYGHGPGNYALDTSNAQLKIGV